MKVRLIAVLLAVAATGFAADHEFDHLVNAVESHYGIKRVHIPLMGVANLAMRIAHPAGARELHVAVFDDLQSCDRCFDVDELDGFIAKASDGALHLTVRTHSHGEAIYLLIGDVGKATKVMIATFGHSQATIVEMAVDVKTLMRLIESPGRANDWAEGQ